MKTMCQYFKGRQGQCNGEAEHTVTRLYQDDYKAWHELNLPVCDDCLMDAVDDIEELNERE